jgi:hypothetical protein
MSYGASADSPPKAVEPKQPVGFLGHLDSLKLELGGLFALITYSGIRDWKWGTAYFRFNPEGWFSMNTGSGGQDKFGHAYTSYLQTEFFYLRLRAYHGKDAAVTVYPPLFTWLIMLYVEVFDGFSVDHGFSYEDLIMDTVGVSSSFLRHTFPEVGKVFDYRLEYFPSSKSAGFHPMLDYSGQKFLLAIRPGELKPLASTALRAAEFYIGYYTRGFEKDAEGDFRSARFYFGVGMDLQGILSFAFGPSSDRPGSFYDHATTALGVFQLPYPYPEVPLHERYADR